MVKAGYALVALLIPSCMETSEGEVHEDVVKMCDEIETIIAKYMKKGFAIDPMIDVSFYGK